MAFGFTLAPAHFQAVMLHILGQGEPRVRHGTYLDDVNVGGNEVPGVWRDTLVAVARLIGAGLPINVWKCQLLALTLVILGHVLCGDSYQMGTKSFKNLFAAGLPRTLRELQSLLGRLNFASTFVPGYKALVAPLVGLMSSRGVAAWRQQHTDALNELAQQVRTRVRLTLCDVRKQLRLHVDAGELYGSVVLVQPGVECLHVVAFAQYTLLRTERVLPLLER